MPDHPTIFVVDDDESCRASLSALLTATGHETLLYVNAEEFLADAHADMHGCLILDVRLPGMSGPQLRRRLDERGIDLPTIFISGHANPVDHYLESDITFSSFLAKPYSGGQLLTAVASALETSKNTGDNEET